MEEGRESGNRDDEEGEARETEVLGVVMYVGLSESGRGRCSVLLTQGKQHPHPPNHTHAFGLRPTATHPQTLPGPAWMERLTNNPEVGGLIPAADTLVLAGCEMAAGGWWYYFESSHRQCP